MFFLSVIIFAQNDLGSKDFGLVNFKGAIYLLDESTEHIPDNIAQMKPIGNIYCTKLDVPTRDFTTGFPGVTDRFEWFGIIYSAVFEIDKTAEYNFKILSDDGSIVWIDNKLILNNDGIHIGDVRDTTMQLNKGLHKIKIWYFQGPATEISLQLFITKPGSEEEIFDLNNFNQKLINATSKLNAVVTEEGIKIQLPAELLFETGKDELKSESVNSLQMLVDIINSYPDGKVKILGFTDSQGSEDNNLKLSEKRANTVLYELQKLKVANTVKFETKGMGSAKPVGNNSTEEGRAANRRVEILIIP